MAGIRKKTTKKIVKPGKNIIEPVAEDMRTKLLKAINPDIEELVIDMKNVNTIDSIGLGLLIAAKNSLEQIDGKLNLTNVPDNIESFLKAIGLDSFFELGTA